MQQPNRFIVTGIGRSGTGFMATVLSKLGLNCDHEAVWGPYGPDPNWYRPPWGDSSWLAVPYLKDQPEHTYIQVVTRDPRAWLGSWMKSHPDGPIPGVKPYTDFLQRHLGWWHDDTPLFDRSVRLWTHWNRLAMVGQFRINRVEDAEMWISCMISEVGGALPDHGALRRVFQNTPTNVNTRGAHFEVTWAEILDSPYGKDMQELAGELGYL